MKTQAKEESVILFPCQPYLKRLMYLHKHQYRPVFCTLIHTCLREMIPSLWSASVVMVKIAAASALVML